jgi:hypothetical protein
MTTNTEVLNSWKEVAAYMGRGVRTVQRWEQELGLPVRRPRAKSRSAVIAFKNELDQWLHRAPKELLQQEHPEEASDVVQAIKEKVPAMRFLHADTMERQAKLHGNTELLITRTKLLITRSHDLFDRLKILQQKVDHTAQLTSKHVSHNAQFRVVRDSKRQDGEGGDIMQKRAIAS